MAFYMVQASYTEEAVKTLVAKPQDRAAVVEKLAKSAGGKLHSFFFTFGEYDIVAIVEAPDNEAAVATGLATVAGGAVSKYRTTVLLTPEESVRAMKRAKKIAYAPPK